MERREIMLKALWPFVMQLSAPVQEYEIWKLSSWLIQRDSLLWNVIVIVFVFVFKKLRFVYWCNNSTNLISFLCYQNFIKCAFYQNKYFSSFHLPGRLFLESDQILLFQHFTPLPPFNLNCLAVKTSYTRK